MNAQQRIALLDLCAGKIDKIVFLEVYGIALDRVEAEVEGLLRRAMLNHDGDEVEYALMLGSLFSFPNNIIDLIHELVVQDWHSRHEDMIGMLQQHHEAISIPILREAITLKPRLQYLDDDDYGSYYKKCLGALQSIGTPEAISAIEECAASEDAALRQQAEDYLTEIRKT
jgi:hypothetical protein